MSKVKWLFLSSYSHLYTQSTPSRSGLTPLNTLLSHYFLSFMPRYLEDVTVPETDDHLTTLVTLSKKEKSMKSRSTFC
jgi:hypothetical protein